MSKLPRGSHADELGRRVEIRNLEVEHLADIRYIHAAAFRLFANPFFDEAEVEAYVAVITSQRYSEELANVIQQGRLLGAWLDGELIGTGGWAYGEDHGESVRIDWLYVRPLFNDSGVGSRLVSEIELRVINAGFKQVAVRSSNAAASFFDRLGYNITSHGAITLNNDLTMQVVFMRKPLKVLPPTSDAHH